MVRLRTFMLTTTIGGIVVILPTILFLIIFRWLFQWMTGLIQPLTNMLITQSHLHEIIADIVIICIILSACFIVGLVVRTKVGCFLRDGLEKHILSIAPGYRIIKETVMQLLGQKKSPFSSVALVKIYNNDALMTAFITDEHVNGWKTVFIPTGPNPTTGYIYHLPLERVFPINIKPEIALRSVIACGAGSQALLKAHNKASSGDAGLTPEN